MADKEKTDVSSFVQHKNQGWGTHKCHTFPPENPARRKKPFKVATSTLVNKFRPMYTFSYPHLIDFKDTTEFRKDLERSFSNLNGLLSVVPPQPGNYASLQNSLLRKQFCEACPSKKGCIHADSFSEIYEIEYSITIKKCPLCGGQISKRSEVTTGFAPIHDVRLSGHPAILNFHKKDTWVCQSCKHVISGLRIPGLQHVLKGELTLRLIRSLFELSLDKVPNAYVAEGYALSTDRVGALSRQFKTRTREEYQSRLLSIFTGNDYSVFYDEPVYIRGKLFRAIFTADKKNFLAILSNDEVESVAHSFHYGSQNSMNFLTQKSFNLSVNYCLTASPPLHRRVLASTFSLICKLELEQSEKPYSGLLPSSYELFGFLRDTSNSRLSLDDFYEYLLDFKSDVPASFTASSQQLSSLILTIYSIRMNLSAWYSEVTDRKKRPPELKHYYAGEIDCLSRLSITELIEARSRESDFPIYEQLARLQYYNEPSVFPTLPLEQQAFPVLNEAGWPSFASSLLGTGIPVECLNHLLNNGLLLKTAPPPPCIRYRLGFAQWLDYSCGCTIKTCPFLHAASDQA